MKIDFNNPEATDKEKKYNFWSSELLRQITRHEGMDAIMRTGYKMLGNPICLTDLGFNTIAITPGQKVDDDPVWKDLYNLGHTTYDTFSLYINSDLYNLQESSFPPFYWENAVSKYRRILCSVDEGNKPAGRLAVIEYEKPFGEDDLRLAAILREAMSVEFQMNKNVYPTAGTIYSTVLTDILSGKIKDKKNIGDKAQLLRLPLNAMMYAVTIKSGDDSIVSGDSLHNFSKDLESLISSGKALVYDGNVFMLMCCNKKNNLFKENIRILNRFLKEHKMKAGVSRCLYNFADLRAYYLQSLHALRLGRIFKDKNAVYFYEDYAIFHMIEVSTSRGKLQGYCHPSLLSLMDYDRQNHTSFTQTLYEFIKNSCSISNTANTLAKHRSSLIYRLEKIKEIMNVDLNDSNILLLLHLSLKIIEYSNRGINLAYLDNVNFQK